MPRLVYQCKVKNYSALLVQLIFDRCTKIFLKEKLKKKQYLFIGIIIVGILILAVLEGE